MSARIRFFRGIVRGASVVSLASVLLVLCAYSQKQPHAVAQDRPRSTMQDVSEALARSVSDRVSREYSTCYFQAAFWGGYDAKVSLGSKRTRDGKPRTLELTQGLFVERIDPEELGSADPNMVRRVRNGTVSLPTSEEAFRKGLPFFVSDAEFESPGVVRYTVISNPGLHIEQAAGSVEIQGDFLLTTETDLPQVFSSSPEPRIMRFNLNNHAGVLYSMTASSPEVRQGGQCQVLFSVVTLTSALEYPSDGGLPCLASNEVALKEVAKPAAPKP